MGFLLLAVQSKRRCFSGNWLGLIFLTIPKTLKPYVSIFCSWNTARTKAGLADVRIHDLRHSYASFLVNAGRSLYEVQRLLGHTQIKTTQRYAHLSHDTLLDATNSVNTTLAGMFVPMVSASPVGQVQLAQ